MQPEPYAGFMTVRNDACVAAGDCPVLPMGFSTLLGMAYAGADLTPVWKELAERQDENPDDGACLIDLSTIAQICGNAELRAKLQAEALKRQRVYRHPSAASGPNPIRLLAFMAPGSFMANTPLELLLDDLDVTLYIAYVMPGQPLPEPVPQHDLAIVAVAESKDNEPVLRELAALGRSWPRPMLNAPGRIARMTRDGVSQMLGSAPGVLIPKTAQISRSDLSQVARGTIPIGSVLDGAEFPVIARPVDSHAGEGLTKIGTPAETSAFLEEHAEPQFYISPFVEYRSRDGMFRKYRIVFIDGCPYACHMAVSDHWMVHYVNAGMLTHADRRDEEARFMAGFEAEFAVRHETSLRAIAERIGLEYFAIDCAEMPDGELLVFEAGNAMVVHAMDPPDLFPYKRPQMDKIFRAFGEMLRRHAARREAF